MYHEKPGKSDPLLKIHLIMEPKRITKTDKSGKPFNMGIGCAEDFRSLCEMYRTFSPKPASQGLPPEDLETCQNWLKNLFQIGENLLAWRGDSVIGHAALIPDVKGKSGEFVIFVDQNDRNLGIGTELTRFTLETFKQLGFDSVWLTVNVTNFIAVKLYKKLGFEYYDTDSYERVMSIKLKMTKPTKY
jgi:ribosomal protein S18 acetylase RimI-like enzyme